MRRETTFGVVLLLAFATGACSTHYVPRAGPRISMVMEGGAPAYAKNGKVYKHGFAGSGLVEAVSDDEEALEAAETYQSRTTTGFLLVLAGTACLTASIVLLATSASPAREDRNSTSDSFVLGTTACGLGGYIGGAAVLASGQPYHFDALNIYNDKVDRRYPRYSPYPHGVPYAHPPGVPVIPGAPVAPTHPPVAPTVPPPAPPPPAPGTTGPTPAAGEPPAPSPEPAPEKEPPALRPGAPKK